MNCFINFTNHPSDKWENEQKKEAEKFGEIIDIIFPAVDPMLREDEIDSLGEQYCKKILCYKPAAVLCQGEFTLAYNIICRLRNAGIRVVAACSERKVCEIGQVQPV